MQTTHHHPRSRRLRRAALSLLGCTLPLLLLPAAEAGRPPRQAPRPTLWQTRGNGFLLELNGDHFRLFETTRLSRLPIGSGEIRDGTMLYNNAPFMSLEDFLGMSDRLRCLPRASLTAPTDDPRILFDLFWTTIDENYAFFELMPPGEWWRLYLRHRPKVTRQTTPAQLWEILATMIHRLNDGHTLLLDFNSGTVAAARAASPSEWMLARHGEYLTAIAGHFDSFSPEDNVLAGGNTIIGTIGGRVGYLNLAAFDGYGDQEITEALPGDPNFSALTLFGAFSDEPAAFSAVLDGVFAALAGMDALIIDLRFNLGGSGDAAVDLANRLAANPGPAYSYRVRHGGHRHFDKPVAVPFTPKTPGFAGKPVIVLTSNNTRSAGDLAAMLLRELPGVLLMGETTYGIFSEGIPRQLPLASAGPLGGWVLTLSTQRLVSARGEFFEQRGVPVDIAVAPDAAALDRGEDNMLDAALAFLARPAVAGTGRGSPSSPRCLEPAQPALQR